MTVTRDTSLLHDTVLPSDCSFWRMQFCLNGQFPPTIRPLKLQYDGRSVVRKSDRLHEQSYKTVLSCKLVAMVKTVSNFLFPNSLARTTHKALNMTQHIFSISASNSTVRYLCTFPDVQLYHQRKKQTRYERNVVLDLFMFTQGLCVVLDTETLCKSLFSNLVFI